MDPRKDSIEQLRTIEIRMATKEQGCSCGQIMKELVQKMRSKLKEKKKKNKYSRRKVFNLLDRRMWRRKIFIIDT